MAYNSKRPVDLRKISRIEIPKKEKVYGGSEEALKVAKAFRDAVEKEIEYSMTNDRSHFNKKVKSRNKSGFVGVHRSTAKDEKKYGTYYYDYWIASIPLGGKKQTTKRFSVSKYGEAKALEHALETRRKGVEKYLEFIEREKELKVASLL
jgi:hypothetical protein